MGFEELASELHKSAEAEGRKIIHAAERGAEKAAEAAQEKADEQVRQAKKEAASAIRQEAAERLTSAKLAAKKMVDEARDEAVEATLHEVWKAFRASSLKKSAYPQLLSRLVAEGQKELGTADAVIYVRDEDRPLLSGLKLGKLPAEYSGGAIVESANGKVRVNRTLEEIFAQKKGELRKGIYDKLF